MINTCKPCTGLNGFEVGTSGFDSQSTNLKDTCAEQYDDSDLGLSRSLLLMSHLSLWGWKSAVQWAAVVI